MKRMTTGQIARYGLMIALALVLSYAESKIPMFIGIPGMKLGLTNIVVLLALYLQGNRSALAINLLRILLVSILFGSTTSLAFSICGGLLSTITMIILKHTEKFRIVTVSICGGIMHNVGQILIAVVMLQTPSLAWYLLVLWASGIISGALIGVLGGILVSRLSIIWEGRKHP